MSACGDVHGWNGAASKRQANDEAASDEEKVNEGLALLVGPLGPLSSVVCGRAEFGCGALSADGWVAANAIAAGQVTMNATRRDIAIRGLLRLIRARLNNTFHLRESAGARTPRRGAVGSSWQRDLAGVRCGGTLERP